MKQEEKINIALIEKHPVLLQTLKFILENVSNYSMIYASQNTLGFSHNKIDILIINEQELLKMSLPINQPNYEIICLSTEFKKMTVKNKIVYLNQACELDELFNTINSLAKKKVIIK
jgi:hypothetical protein